MWQPGWEEFRGRMDTCTRMAESLHCSPEAITTLLIGHMCVCVNHSDMSYSLQSHGLQPARLLCPWNSPDKDTGVDCHSLLQGIFLTQGSNPHLIMSPALVGGFFTFCVTWKAPNWLNSNTKWKFKKKKRIKKKITMGAKIKFTLIGNMWSMY